MDTDLILIFGLTFVIHLIGTLAYAVRIAGTRTGRIAIALSLFNILILVSRTSNSFQAPLLAKRVEENLREGRLIGAEADFRWLLLAATAATILGAVLIPTFQRIFAQLVQAFSRYRSVPRLFLRGLSPAGLVHLRSSIRIPAWSNLVALPSHRPIPWNAIAFNTIAMAVWTVGVFSALYAGYLNPELRVTASQLSAVINGVATILMFVFIDPYLSLLSDETTEGKVSEPEFRRTVVWLTGSRLAGTVLAQLLLVPGALWIAAVAEWL